jgi:hypothetical protein
VQRFPATWTGSNCPADAYQPNELAILAFGGASPFFIFMVQLPSDLLLGIGLRFDEM